MGGRKGERTSSGHVKKHPIQLGKESNQFVSLLFLVRGTETCLQTEKELTERQKLRKDIRDGSKTQGGRERDIPQRGCRRGPALDFISP